MSPPIAKLGGKFVIVGENYRDAVSRLLGQRPFADPTFHQLELPADG
jgi:hypothetical protein